MCGYRESFCCCIHFILLSPCICTTIHIISFTSPFITSHTPRIHFPILLYTLLSTSFSFHSLLKIRFCNQHFSPWCLRVFAQIQISSVCNHMSYRFRFHYSFLPYTSQSPLSAIIASFDRSSHTHIVLSTVSSFPSRITLIHTQIHTHSSFHITILFYTSFPYSIFSLLLFCTIHIIRSVISLTHYQSSRSLNYSLIFLLIHLY